MPPDGGVPAAYQLGPAVTTRRRYSAFISYSHSDEPIANWLHKRLETYRIPKAIGGGRHQSRIGKVFRDRVELNASHDLGGEIRKALDGSDALVLLCSPRSAKSPYVAEEIRRFKETGKGDRIFAVIVDGEPHAAGKPGRTADEECFPRALIHRLDPDGQLTDELEPTEPIAADFRGGKDGRENGSLKIIAGLLGVGLDDLVQRERRAERARRLRANAIAIVMAVLALGAVVGGGFAWWLQGVAEASRIEATAQRDRAVANETRAKAGEELAQRNAEEREIQRLLAVGNLKEAQRQTVTSALRLSNVIANEAKTLFATEQGDHTRSLLLALYANPEAHLPDLPPEMSPAEGFALARFQTVGAQQTNRMLHVLKGHEATIRFSTFSADGRSVLTATDREVRVWDTKTGTPSRMLRTTLAPGYGASVSANDRLAVITGETSVAEVRDINSGGVISRLEGHAKGFVQSAVSSDGKLVVTGADDGNARIWNAADGVLLQTLSHPERVNAVTFSRSGKLVATASRDGRARIWNPATGELIQTLTVQPTDSVFSLDMRSVGFSGDERFVVTTDNSQARVWNIGTGALVRTVKTYSAATAASLSEDGRFLVTAGRDGVARITDHTGFERLRVQANAPLSSVAFSPNHRLIVTGTEDGTVQIWDATLDTAAAAIAEDPSGASAIPITSAALSSDMRSIVAGSEDGSVRLWNVVTRKMVRTFEGADSEILSIALSEDGRYLAAGSRDGIIHIWSSATGKEVRGGKSYIREESLAVAFSHQGRFVPFVATRGGLRMELGALHAATGMAVREPLVPFNQVKSASISRDGRLAAVSLENGTAQLWNVESGKMLHELGSLGEKFTSASFSDDARYVIFGLASGKARIWDTSNGSAVRTLNDDFGTVSRAVALSADGRLAATGDYNTAHVWDVATGVHVATLSGHARRISTIAFSRDTRTLVTGSEDGTLRLWTVPSLLSVDKGSQVTMACQMLRDANAPLAFRVSDIATFGVLEGYEADPRAPELLTSPCRDRLPANAFDPKTAKDAWMRVYR